MSRAFLSVTCSCGLPLIAEPQDAGQLRKCPACQCIVRIPFGTNFAPRVVDATVIARSTSPEPNPQAELHAYLIVAGIALCLFIIVNRDWLQLGSESRGERTVQHELAAPQAPPILPLRALPETGVTERSHPNSLAHEGRQPTVFEGGFGEAKPRLMPDTPPLAAVDPLASGAMEHSQTLANTPEGVRVTGDATVSPSEVKPSPAEDYDGPTANSYVDGLQLSRRLSKPMLLFFFAESCLWCRKMKSETLTDKGVQSAMQKYVCVTLDANDKVNVHLTSKYAVKGLPTYVITDPNGKLIKSGAGFRPEPSTFGNWLNDTLVWQRMNSLSKARQN